MGQDEAGQTATRAQIENRPRGRSPGAAGLVGSGEPEGMADLVLQGAGPQESQLPGSLQGVLEDRGNGGG